MFSHTDADTDPNASIYAAIIIPLMFAGLAALTFVCCRKYVKSAPLYLAPTVVPSFASDIYLSLYRNKENIFPKVPQPRDLLSDVSDNNNKVTVFIEFCFLIVLCSSVSHVVVQGFGESYMSVQYMNRASSCQLS